MLPMQEVKSVKVQRFYRPEDISADLGYRAGFWDIYASSEQEEVDVEDAQALCQVRRSGYPTGGLHHDCSSSGAGLQHSLASEGDGDVYAMCQQEGMGWDNVQASCQVRRRGPLTDAMLVDTCEQCQDCRACWRER